MSTHWKLHKVPVYDLTFCVGVSNDTDALQKKVGPYFGQLNLKKLHGLSLHDGSFFAVLFGTDDLCHELIAHEVFHVTHRIMEFCSNDITRVSHEPHAYLNGFLTQLVYTDMKRWGIRVNTKSNYDHTVRKYKRQAILEL